MADFTSDFWSWFIIIVTGVSFVAMFILLRWLSGAPQKPGEKVETMGHVWDGDLEELNNPLPRWWLGMFYITLFFGIGYLLLYPGMGTFAGFLGWTQTGQYDEEVAAAEARYGPLYEQFLAQDLKTVAADDQAKKMGRRLFLNYCAQCHGSDAGGSRGFPSLNDYDWLYGGEPETIKASIMDGRNGIMPPWEDSLGNEGVTNVALYVTSLSGREVDPVVAAKGKQTYATLCVACHGADGKGNPAMGAPNLTDHVWLYGGSQKRIIESIAKGRSGNMPAHREFLGEAKAHLLAAYIYSLSNK